MSTVKRIINYVASSGLVDRKANPFHHEVFYSQLKTAGHEITCKAIYMELDASKALSNKANKCD